MTFPAIPLDMLPSDLQGSDNTARANIIINAFRIAVNGSLSVQNMVDGVVDEFEDETGVDTSTSIDETYDASGDYYHNNGLTTVYSSASEWTGNTGGFSFSGDDCDITGNQVAIKSVDTFAAGVDFTYTMTVAAGGVDGHGNNFGFYDVAHDGLFLQNHETAGIKTGGMTRGWLLGGWTGNSHACYNSIDHGSYCTFDNGDVFVFERVGGTAKLYENSSLIYTYSETSTTEVRLILSGNAVGSMSNVSWASEVPPPNMVLQSNAFTAEAAPDEAFLVVWQEDVDGVTLNTDLLAYVSRDGGTTWAQVTLVEEATLSTGRILAASVDVSGQPSGTSMKWKLAVTNNKEQRVHGIGLSWS
jgi:hypothetical protein